MSVASPLNDSPRESTRPSEARANRGENETAPLPRRRCPAGPAARRGFDVPALPHGGAGASPSVSTPRSTLEVTPPPGGQSRPGSCGEYLPRPVPDVLELLPRPGPWAPPPGFPLSRVATLARVSGGGRGPVEYAWPTSWPSRRRWWASAASPASSSGVCCAWRGRPPRFFELPPPVRLDGERCTSPGRERISHHGGHDHLQG